MFLFVSDFLKIISFILFRLNHNNLKFFDRSTFLGLTNLTELRLHNNQIEKLEPYLFKDLQSLTYLDLSNNRISQLSNYVFNNCRQLVKLGLEGNSLSNLPSNPSSFYKTILLEKVCFKGNPLAMLPIESLERLICNDRPNCQVLTEQACCDQSDCIVPN